MRKSDVFFSFWQSPLWREILGKSKQADVYELEQGGNRISIERRHIWKGFTGLYVLGISPSLVTEKLLGEIYKKIRQKGDLFLQIEPFDFVEENRKQKIENTVDFAYSKGKAPFRRFLEPVTAVLNIHSKDEESLLASFAEKGRYNIRLAEKRGVTARWVQGSEMHASGKTYIEIFYTLLEETTSRDGFSGNSLKYYQDFIEVLERNTAGGLLIVEKDGIIHAGGIFVYWEGQAIYYYGASSSNPEIRRDMATYLVQWEAIREALRRSCHTYDFLGISPDGTGKLAGVTEFKLRFSPEKQHLPREQVIIYKPLLLFLLQCMSKLRKLAKK